MRTGRASLDRSGNGKWTSSFFAKRCGATGQALRISTAKPIVYRRMRIGTAQRELSRSNGMRFLASGHGYVPHADWLRRYRATVYPNGTHFWYKDDDGLWSLGKFSTSTTTGGVYLVPL